jgi:hypothetical protein
MRNNAKKVFQRTETKVSVARLYSDEYCRATLVCENYLYFCTLQSLH